MALKLKFKSRDEMPDEVAHLYVERDGEFVLDVQQETDSGRRPDATSVGWRIPLPAEVPPEKRTIRHLAEVAAANQKMTGLESEVRRLAKDQGLDRTETNRLAERARSAWRVVNGDLLPVAQDRQTVLLAAGGERVLSLHEWVLAHCHKEGSENLGRGGTRPYRVEETFPMRNPFRRKTWNLTEQMRLQRRDSALAKRLKAQAWAEGS